MFQTASTKAARCGAGVAVVAIAALTPLVATSAGSCWGLVTVIPSSVNAMP